MAKIYSERLLHCGLKGMIKKAYFGEEFLYYVVYDFKGNLVLDAEKDIDKAMRVADYGKGE